MSNMLEQAIIDAEDLKEAAKKSAEEKIVEHFSRDIKDAINTILEQEELTAVDPTLGLVEDPMLAPPAPAPTIDIEAEGGIQIGDSVVEQAPYAATTSNDEFVSIDLDKLEESIANALTEEELDEDLELEEVYELDEDLESNEPSEVCPSGMDQETADKHGCEKLDENSDSLEEMIRSALAEEFLAEDEEKETKETKEAEEAEKETKEETQNESIVHERNLLKLMYSEQVDVADELTEKNKKYRTFIQQLKEEVQKVNLSNAKLLYQNRVLKSVSLNERQKDRIVETITNADTVEEAKIIYETLQSAVGTRVQSHQPKSLNEVVTKSSSAFVPRKEDKREDPFMVRMKTLAGITDK